MEYVPLDPLIDKALKLIAERIGHPLACPMCGGTDWSALHNRFLRLSTPLDMTEAEIDTAPDSALYANLKAVALICDRCEFVALHAVSEDVGEADSGTSAS